MSHKRQTRYSTACVCMYFCVYFSFTWMTKLLLTVLWLTLQHMLNKITGEATKHKQEQRIDLRFSGKRPTAGAMYLIYCYKAFN